MQKKTHKNMKEAEYEALSLLYNYSTDFMSDIRTIEKRYDEIKALIDESRKKSNIVYYSAAAQALNVTARALKVITHRRYEASLSEIQAIRNIHPEYDWRTHDEYLDVFNYLKKTDITNIDKIGVSRLELIAEQLEISSVELAIKTYAYENAGLKNDVFVYNYFDLFDTTLSPEQLKVAYDARVERDLR